MTAGDAAGQGPRVLLVDHDPDILALFAYILRRAGYTTQTARSADAALALLEVGVLAAVVDCTSAPGEFATRPLSLETVRALRTAHPTLPLILCSAHPDAPWVDRAAEGLAAILPKPFDRRALLDAVSRAAGVPGPDRRQSPRRSPAARAAPSARTAIPVSRRSTPTRLTPTQLVGARSARAGKSTRRGMGGIRPGRRRTVAGRVRLSQPFCPRKREGVGSGAAPMASWDEGRISTNGRRRVMTPDVAEAMAIVGQLWTAGKEADRALLDRVVALGSVATTLLIEMALDESLHNAAETSPDVWAPLHAIRLLGELAAAEAVEPLFPLFAWDDDYLAIDLPEAYGRIGQPAMSALRRLVGDRGGDIWARVRATSALEKVVDYHPELRGDVVATLLAHLDSDETDTADIDILHGFVVSSLVELRAEEAIGSIRRAFEENRVDLMVIEESTVQETFGLPRETWSTLPRERRLSSFRDRLLAIPPPPRCMAEERAGRARDGPGAPRAASAASEARA